MRLFVFLFAISSLALADANWPQFRGEGGLGIGTGKPPVEFSADKHLKWKAAAPKGHSSPCIFGDKIALTGFVSFEQVAKKATTARNPRTGETVKVKAKKAPKVTIGASFKKTVNKEVPAPKLAK